MKKLFHQEFLEDIFNGKVQRNSAYSWRAFARDLNISHSTLLGMINGTRLPNFNLALTISEKLKLNNQLSLIFLDSINRQKLNKGIKNFQKKIDSYIEKNKNDNPKIKYLTPKQIEELSDWYFYAILEILEIKGFKNNAKWISQRLNFSEEKIKAAMDKLQSFGLIKQINHKWIKTSFFVSTKTKKKERKDDHLIKIQKSFLEKSLESLETTPYELRSHNSMTMAINPDKLPQAKEEIRKFIYRLSEILEVDEKKEVYELQVSLFPLTHD